MSSIDSPDAREAMAKSLVEEDQSSMDAEQHESLMSRQKTGNVM